jgi:hypothetical protein
MHRDTIDVMKEKRVETEALEIQPQTVQEIQDVYEFVFSSLVA